MEQVRTDLGDPTALVTAPAVNESVSIEDMPVESWRRMIDVNLSGTFYCLKAAIPAMKQDRYGRTVLFGSNIALKVARGSPITARPRAVFMRCPGAPRWRWYPRFFLSQCVSQALPRVQVKLGLVRAESRLSRGRRFGFREIRKPPISH